MSVEKINILSAGNNGYLYRYEIIKSELTSKKFISFMKSLKFDEEKIYDEFFSYWADPPFDEERWYGDFSKRENDLFNIKNINFDVEVICFKNKNLVLLIRTKKHKELIKNIDKFFKFIKEK